MPTNVSRPIWVCDICKTRFDDDLEAAQRCESAPPAEFVLDGELLLQRFDDGPRHCYELVPLERKGVDTRASRWNKEPRGHVAVYGTQDRTVSEDILWPNRPGFAQIVSTGWLTRRDREFLSGLRSDRPWTARIAELIGVDVGVEAHLGVHTALVGPLTPEVRAVLDALRAEVVPQRPFSGERRTTVWELSTLGALARLHDSAGARTDSRRAEWFIATSDVAALVAEANDLWRRWRAGENVTVPVPRLRCRRALSPSKLDREMRALVEAAGVEWPKRTDSDYYASHLISEKLEVAPMDEDELTQQRRRFPVRTVVAVRGTKGGVGKSTVAAALARAVAARGKRTVLVDLDLNGPSQHLLFGLGESGLRTDTSTRRIIPSTTEVDGLGVVSTGQVSMSHERWLGQNASEWIDFLGSCIDWSGVDVVVLDMPPGFGTIDDIVSAEPDLRSVWVTTGHPLALSDTERAFPSRGREVRREGAVLVENMSVASGESTEGATATVRLLGVAGAAEQLAERVGITYGGSLPWQPEPSDLAATAELSALAELVLA